MHLTVNRNGYLKVVPQTLKELSALEKFPGFVNGIAPGFRNLLKRFLKAFPNTTADPQVNNYLLPSPTSKELPRDFKFYTEPLPFQHLALRLSWYRPNIAFLLDPGLGKTKVTLDWLLLRRAERVLVVCPSPLVNVWREEIKTHRPEFSFFHIKTTDIAKELRKAGNANLLVCSYAVASAGAKQLVAWNPDSLVVDEALIKNPASLRTRELTWLSQQVKNKALLSGTLINNDPGEVFAPVRLLEPSLFGIRTSVFKEAYFEFSYQGSKDGKPHPTRAKEEYWEELRDVLRSVSVVMRKEQYLPYLPKKIFHPLFLEVTDVQKDLVDQIRSTEGFRYGDRKPVVLSTPLSCLGKILQVENYFYYEPDTDEDEESLEELFLARTKHRKKSKLLESVVLGNPANSPKGLALQRLAEETGTQRGIIWYNFSAELGLIKAALKDPYLVVNGKTKNAGDCVAEFNNNPNIRWLVAQARVLNYGVTVLGSDEEEDGEVLPPFDSKVHLEIFMSLNFSYEVFVQQQDRIHRIGQQHECHYYFLLADSIGERRVWEILESKKDVREYMLAPILKK